METHHLSTFHLKLLVWSERYSSYVSKSPPTRLVVSRPGTIGHGNPSGRLLGRGAEARRLHALKHGVRLAEVMSGMNMPHWNGGGGGRGRIRSCHASRRGRIVGFSAKKHTHRRNKSFGGWLPPSRWCVHGESRAKYPDGRDRLTTHDRPADAIRHLGCGHTPQTRSYGQPTKTWRSAPVNPWSLTPGALAL